MATKVPVGARARAGRPRRTISCRTTVLTLLMQESGWSVDDLAKKFGTTPMTVIFWRTGRRSPTFAHGAALEKLFGMPLNRLLTSVIDLPIAPAGDYHVIVNAEDSTAAAIAAAGERSIL